LIDAMIESAFHSMSERVRGVIERLEAFMKTVDDALALPRASAAFAHTLTLVNRARTAVEIGTSYGYSGLWIASALSPGGKLITIDHDQRKADAARRNFDDAGLSKVGDVRVGAAIDVLREFDGPIDLVLNDADKENCVEYVKILVPKLSDRAVVLTDNTQTHAEKLAGFITWIRTQPGFVSTGVPIGSGMELSVYCRSSQTAWSGSRYCVL